MEPGFAGGPIDTSRAHPARMYDAYLGGKDNYAVDRDAVRQVLQAAPEVRDTARANRAFLQRAVRFLVGEAGIRQIIDIGTGIPTAGNVHQISGEVAPGTRVIYVDNDHCKPGCAQSAWIFGVRRDWLLRRTSAHSPAPAKLQVTGIFDCA